MICFLGALPVSIDCLRKERAGKCTPVLNEKCSVRTRGYRQIKMKDQGLSPFRSNLNWGSKLKRSPPAEILMIVAGSPREKDGRNEKPLLVMLDAQQQWNATAGSPMNRLRGLNTKEAEYQLYPNPNVGLFTLAFDARQDTYIDLLVLNMYGCQVISPMKIFAVAGSNALQIDVRSIVAGAYYLGIKNDETHYIVKFIKSD